MPRPSAGRPPTSTVSCGSTPTHVYLSYSADTSVPVIGAVQDEDVVRNNGGAWSVYFDGTAHGLGASGNLDLDAISFASGALAPPPPPPSLPLFFSTSGNTNPPGVGGTADSADIYNWNGTAYSRLFDTSASGVTVSNLANVDGYDRIDDAHFYLSFSFPLTQVAGISGLVRDEDVVYYNAGTWSKVFDGGAHGFDTNLLSGTNAAQDLDAISMVGGVLYFSTTGNANPPGVSGTPDDADIYSWNGTAFARVWDASANGLTDGANVDGYVRVDATHFYLSFGGDTSLPGLGAVQDEDVVYYNGTSWSVYFDGTAHGLGSSGDLDVDAFDVP